MDCSARTEHSSGYHCRTCTDQCCALGCADRGPEVTVTDSKSWDKSSTGHRSSTYINGRSNVRDFCAVPLGDRVLLLSDCRRTSVALHNVVQTGKTAALYQCGPYPQASGLAPSVVFMFGRERSQSVTVALKTVARPAQHWYRDVRDDHWIALAERDNTVTNAHVLLPLFSLHETFLRSQCSSGFSYILQDILTSNYNSSMY